MIQHDTVYSTISVHKFCSNPNIVACKVSKFIISFVCGCDAAGQGQRAGAEDKLLHGDSTCEVVGGLPREQRDWFRGAEVAAANLSRRPGTHEIASKKHGRHRCDPGRPGPISAQISALCRWSKAGALFSMSPGVFFEPAA